MLPCAGTQGGAPCSRNVTGVRILCLFCLYYGRWDHGTLRELTAARRPPGTALLTVSAEFRAARGCWKMMACASSARAGRFLLWNSMWKNIAVVFLASLPFYFSCFLFLFCDVLRLLRERHQAEGPSAVTAGSVPRDASPVDERDAEPPGDDAAEAEPADDDAADDGAAPGDAAASDEEADTKPTKRGQGQAPLHVEGIFQDDRLFLVHRASGREACTTAPIRAGTEPVISP